MPDEIGSNGHDEGSNLLHEILAKLATNDQVFEHRTQSLALKMNELTDNVDRLTVTVNAMSSRIDKLVVSIGKLIAERPIRNEASL